MNPPYLDILETAIDQYKIPNVMYIEGVSGWAIIKTKTIHIPQPKTLYDLLVGLHEIGHVALEHPTRPGLPWSAPEWKKFIKEEQEAWKFAFQEIDNYKMFIDIKTLGTCRDQYEEYVKTLLTL